MTKITSSTEIPSGYEEGSEHKAFFVIGTIDGEEFSVTVSPFSGEYDYDKFPESLMDDDESLQIAIGEYWEKNNTDIGKVGR